jgi:hypothetical protein
MCHLLKMMIFQFTRRQITRGDLIFWMVPWKIIFKSTTVELSSIQLVWFCGWDPRLSAPCEVKHPSDLDKVRQRAKKLPGMPRMIFAGLDRHGFLGNQKGTGWKRMGSPISIRVYIYILYIYIYCIYIYTVYILYIVMYIYIHIVI